MSGNEETSKYSRVKFISIMNGERGKEMRRKKRVERRGKKRAKEKEWRLEEEKLKRDKKTREYYRGRIMINE